MKKCALALDLVEDDKLIEEYVAHHKEVWPEIKQSILSSGIIEMEIFHAGNRLFMLLEVDEDFSFEKKAEQDSVNLKVQEWEKMMWNYQKAIPAAKPGEKWVLMESIFKLIKQT